MNNMRYLFPMATITLLLVVALASAASVKPTETLADNHVLPVTHGVTVGDVTSNSAVIWSRTDREGFMNVRLKGPRGFIKSIKVTKDHDFTGKVPFYHLRANTDYSYQVWFSSKRFGVGKPPKDDKVGTFLTAQKEQIMTPVRFVFGGDVGGQNVCRDAILGYPLFETVDNMNPDFFIGLGDMIYADGVCEATGEYGNLQVPGDFDRAATMKDFWGHWKYNRGEQNFLNLLSHTPYIAVWDDHEVVNNFGPLHDTRDTPPYTPGEHLMPKGLQAFLDYNPIAEHADTPKRLYRNIRWGKALELMILDNRQYRDANSEPDTEQFPKTMLGREQMVWLKNHLLSSDATWKVIVSSVPLSIPTGGSDRDGWGNFDQDTGFEQELLSLARFLRDHDIHNVVFITTDVHFAEAFRYQPFPESPEFEFYEFVSGPMNAGLFPNRDFDESLGTESLFFFGPKTSSEVTNYQDALRWMNFGMIEIDQEGVLHASIRNIKGEAVYQLELPPQ